MKLTRYRLKGKENIRIALVADLHEYDPGPVIDALKKARPDMICIAGDTFERSDHGQDPRSHKDYSLKKRLFYKILHLINDSTLYVKQRLLYRKNPRSSANGYRLLREAAGIAPVYLSLGNHEWYLNKRDKKELKENSITLLDNSDVRLGNIVIGGLSPGADMEWLRSFEKQEGMKILLCHHPEFYERYLKGKDIDLILSGHAHGGQIRLFGRALFAPGQGLLPKYTRGIYDGRLVVSAGCANTAAVPRTGNPCEVVVLEIRHF